MIMRAFYQRFLRIRDVPVPVIAAINGPAIGAGLCFAMACDIRLAAESAKMGITFVGLGLSTGMGASFYLPKLIGAQQAAKMILTAQVVDGKQAAASGLVLEAVPEADLQAKAISLAETIASNAPLAVRASLRSLRMLQDDGLDRALWREADAQSYCYSSPDIKEGMAAVSEKRKPNFTQSEQYKE
jgi:enoyl-CoA hydratase